MNDPFDLVLDQQPFLAQAVDGLVVGAVAFGGYHLLVLGVVLLVQFVQVLILLYECLECISGNVQVSEQIMRNWHFFTSVRVVGKVLTIEDSCLCAGL
ncbi:hypothetical protein D3C71_1758510 [compost metagenome]